MAVSEDIDYEVHRILDRYVTDESKIEYLIRWKGFNSDWDSWEPTENLSSCTKKIALFEKRFRANAEQAKNANAATNQNYAKKLINKSKMTMKAKQDPVKLGSVKLKHVNKFKRGKQKSIGSSKNKDVPIVNGKTTKSVDKDTDFHDIFDAVLNRSKSEESASSSKDKVHDLSEVFDAVLNNSNSSPETEKVVVVWTSEESQKSMKNNKKVKPLIIKKKASVLSPTRTKHVKPKLASPGLNQILNGKGKSDQSKAGRSPMKRKVESSVVKLDKENDVSANKIKLGDSNQPEVLAQGKSSQKKLLNGNVSKDIVNRKRKTQSESTPVSKLKSPLGNKKSSKSGEISRKKDISFSSDDDMPLSAVKKAKRAYSQTKASKSVVDKPILSLVQQSDAAKTKASPKTATKVNDNKKKANFKLSVAGLVGNKQKGAGKLNQAKNSMKLTKSKNATISQDPQEKKSKLYSTSSKKQKIVSDSLVIESDGESDEEVLYSLSDQSNIESPPTTKVAARSKSESVVPASKVKKVGAEGKKTKKSKSTSATVKDKSESDTKGKKIRLIDSLTKSPTSIATAKPLRPVSPTPPFTTVKHTTATATVLPTTSQASPPHVPQWVVVDDVQLQVLPSTEHQASLPISPASMSYKVLLENLPHQLHPKKNKKTGEAVEEDIERRVSVRASECAFKYKEIIIKKCQKYTQIWLHTHTKMKNALNPTVMHEIGLALNAAKYDDSNLVMFSGLGNVFCSGIDLHYLTTGDRKVAARNMVDALRDLVRKFITFPKLIVAVVTGPAIGLGTTMLPLCDIVYASDKATFYMPYALLSQTPEGCASYTLPVIVGTAMANELLIGGRKITAIEACQLGLVSQVYWPTSMMQEVIPRVQHMALLSGKALETTKLLMRSHQRTKLDLTNESECNLLMERWASFECQKAIDEFLCSEKNYML